MIRRLTAFDRARRSPLLARQDFDGQVRLILNPADPQPSQGPLTFRGPHPVSKDEPAGAGAADLSNFVLGLSNDAPDGATAQLRWIILRQAPDEVRAGLTAQAAGLLVQAETSEGRHVGEFNGRRADEKRDFGAGAAAPPPPAAPTEYWEHISRNGRLFDHDHDAYALGIGNRRVTNAALEPRTPIDPREAESSARQVTSAKCAS